MADEKEMVVGADTPRVVNYNEYVDKFPTFRIYLLYLFKILYVIGCLGLVAAVVMVPFIYVDAPVDSIGAFNFDFTGFTSIFSILMTRITNFTADTSNFKPLAEIVIVVVWVILILITVIWAFIKFWVVGVLLSSVNFKKKAIVTECLAKAKHREYDFGQLNYDCLWIMTFATVGFIFACTLMDGALPDVFGSNIKLFNVFANQYWQNGGTTLIFIIAGVTLLLQIWSLVYRELVVGKVKKYFGLGKR